ncbi:MAG: fluoride efflux transporter CrcB [Chloroflexi bacterium]|nr:fluoride efflux transporter CrcB [Chloroflexota bacterium]
MSNILLVGIGGFIGSILRYLVSGWAQQISRSVEFPYGTLAVNLIGCFIIGALAQLADARGIFSSEARAFVFIGILGGFTTFSSFGNETMNLLRDGESLRAFANVSAHIVLGLGAVWLGRALAFAIWR